MGVATPVLTETIGDDVPRLVHEFKKNSRTCPARDRDRVPPQAIPARTWTAGTRPWPPQWTSSPIPIRSGTAGNVLPGFVLPEDIRHIKDILEDFGLAATVLAGHLRDHGWPALLDYEKIPSAAPPTRHQGHVRGQGHPGIAGFWAWPKAPGTSGAPLRRAPDIIGPMGIRETDACSRPSKTSPAGPAPARYAGSAAATWMRGRRPQVRLAQTGRGLRREDLVIG